MSFPSKEDLDALLQAAQGQPAYTIMASSAEHLIYLIENLRRVNGEIATQADRLDDLQERYDELHEDYNEQLRRAKKWKRKYKALESKTHEEVRQDPHDPGGQDGAGA